MTIENAIIKTTSIFLERGMLTAFLEVEYNGGGSCQGFGGHNLYSPSLVSKKNFAGIWLFRVLETVGVEKWSQLNGKAIRIKHDFCNINAIGHITRDKWFCPREEF